MLLEKQGSGPEGVKTVFIEQRCATRDMILQHGIVLLNVQLGNVKLGWEHAKLQSSQTEQLQIEYPVQPGELCQSYRSVGRMVVMPTYHQVVQSVQQYLPVNAPPGIFFLCILAEIEVRQEILLHRVGGGVVMGKVGQIIYINSWYLTIPMFAV